jgi:hypothetical protein
MIGGIHGPTGISDHEIRATTGKGWAEWMGILETWQRQQSHPKGFGEMMRYLRRQYRLRLYWAQAVTAQYILTHEYTGKFSGGRV